MSLLAFPFHRTIHYTSQPEGKKTHRYTGYHIADVMITAIYGGYAQHGDERGHPDSHFLSVDPGQKENHQSDCHMGAGHTAAVDVADLHDVVLKGGDNITLKGPFVKVRQRITGTDNREQKEPEIGYEEGRH